MQTSRLEWFTNSRSALLLLWALYLIPRALLILLDVSPWSDALYYYERAEELAAGKGYLSPDGMPTAFWPPGWPLALSVAFRLLGVSGAVVGLFNLACAALSALLVLLLGRKLFDSALTGRLALLLLALYPNNAAYVPLALTEVFYTTLLLAICWLLVAGRGWKALIFAGFLLGVATLVKAQTLAVVPLVLGIGVLRVTRSWSSFWRAIPPALGKTVLLVALAALAVAPWSLRNQRELGTLVTVSTNGGFTLLTGNNDTATGGYTPEDPVVRALEARSDLDEVTRDAEARRLGMAWISANPGRFLALMPMKFVKLWGPDGEAIWSYEEGSPAWDDHAALFKAVRWANQGWYWLLLLGFGAAAVIQLRRRWGNGRPLFDWWLLPYGIAAYPTAICLVFSGQTRFHYPAMPFIAMAAAWFVADWLSRRNRMA